MQSHSHQQATPLQGTASRKTGSIHEQKSKLFQRKQRGDATSSTASEAASIQQSLARTQTLLRNELDRVSHVASAIEDDGKLLQETMGHHETLNVAGAKKALTALERAQRHEQRVLMSSIVFFWAVVFYIMWSRILIRLPFVERVTDLLSF